jgi:NADH-quinone oxidoreductase subunit H
MKFGWKFLLPVSIAWIVIVATGRALRNEGGWEFQDIVQTFGIPIAALLVAFWMYEEVRERREKRVAAMAKPRASVEFDPFAGGHPVPPMPGQVLPSTKANALPEKES